MINTVQLIPILRRRWPVLALAGTLAGGAAIGVLRLQQLVREELPGFLDARLEAALHREVDLGPVSLSPLGAHVAGLRIHRIAAEREDPLLAKGLDVELDCWQLLTRREVKVHRVVADGARVFLTQGPKAAQREPWTDQVLALSQAGIERFAVRTGSIELEATNGPSTWSTTGVTGELVLGSRQFRYAARVQRFASAELELTGLEAQGSGDAQGVTLKQGAGTFQGGRIHANGSLKAAGNAALLTLRVEKLPLGRLATRIGIPAKWAMQGTVTGQVTVDARDNGLRSIRGALDVARGSLNRGSGEFPWQSAHAAIDWTPEATRLTDVKVQGKDLTLTAVGDVTASAGKPFTEGRFEVDGKIVATRAAAVAQVADLLAFRQLLEGRWSAGSSTVEFNARGRVGEIEQANAKGKLHVEQFTFRPTADSEPVLVEHLDADLTRNAQQLELANVRAQTDGLTVAGAASMTNARKGERAEFLASGSVDVRDLKSLRTAVPQASLWKWVPVVSPSASGRLEFRLGGPVGDVEQLWSDGKFEVRNFRLTAHSPLPNDAFFFVPVKVATATFRHAHRRLEVGDLQIEAPTFGADGGLSLDFAAAEPRLAADLTVRTDDWRSLPALTPGTLSELSGGKFAATVHADGKLSQLAHSEVAGSFVIDHPTYTPARDGAQPVALDQVSARFRWAGGATVRERSLELPEIRLASALLNATASGEAVRGEAGYQLRLKVHAQTAAAGQLAGKLTDAIKLTGGAAEVDLTVDAPVKHLAAGSIDGQLQLTDASLEQPVELLGLRKIEAHRLEVAFSGREGAWQIAKAELAADGLEASLSGRIEGSAIDAQLSAQSATWNAPAKLPVAGGSVALSGHLVRNAAGEPFTFARPRFESKSLSLSGGALNAVLHGSGPVADPAQWVQSGELKIDNARWGAAKFAASLTAAATLVREGDGFRLSSGTATTAGAHAALSGLWTPQGHTLQMDGEVADLSQFGVSLPAGTRTGAVKLTGTVTGTPAQPLARAQAEIATQNLTVKMAQLGEQRLASLTGRLDWDGAKLRLEGLRGAGPAVTFAGTGEWTKSGHRLALTATGAELNRLGLELPETMNAGSYTLTAELTGTAKQPVADAIGSVRLEDARFQFGRSGPQQFARLESRFRLAGGRITLSDLTATGAAGDFAGSGLVEADRYQIHLASVRVNPDLVRWTVPGRMSGGALAGTLLLEGHGAAVDSASGRFEFTHGEYTAPKTLELVDRSLRIDRLAADYRWQRGGEAGKTTLTDIRLATNLGEGTGTLTTENGAGRVTAELTSGDAGRIADRWPALNGRLLGGRGTGALDLAFDPAGVRGTLQFAGQGGTVHLPGEVAEYADHPVERLSGTLGFEPGKLTFTDMKLRGPKGNLDGTGTWQDGGAVAGTGKAWFAKDYTSKLIKPSGFGWLAKLFGLREVKSDFTLSGTSSAVSLNASITRSLVWKLAKGKVPAEFQKIATGKSPLCVKPEVVAEAPVVEATTAGGGE